MSYHKNSPAFTGTVTLVDGPLVLAASQGIVIPDGAPGVTTNKLYQVGGVVYFNGATLGGGGGLSLGSTLTGFALGTDGTALATTDTILQGFQKLQVQANNKVSFPGFGATGALACVGNDSRLSDSRTASDVYAWAKAATKPTYQQSEITLSAPTIIAYAATINIDLTTINVENARITLTGPCTINFTGGSNGQKLTLELLQDGTGGRVVTLGTGIGYGADITSYTGNTTLNKRDLLGFTYNSALSKALLVAIAKGY